MLGGAAVYHSRELKSDLRESARAAENLLAIDREHLLEYARILGSNQEIARELISPTPNSGVLFGVGNAIRHGKDPDIITITSASGVVLANIRIPYEIGEDLSRTAPVQKALEEGKTSVYFSGTSGEFAHLATIPVISRGEIIGTITTGILLGIL